MDKQYRILICEFHEESNTFNPVLTGFDRFNATRNLEGDEFFAECRATRCAVQGMLDAIEEFGGIAIPSVDLFSCAGGPVEDQIVSYLTEKMDAYIAAAGQFDAIFASLHGATCSENIEDVCGMFVEHLRKLVGEDVIIAASFDLHGNITERLLKNIDVVCGYQTYPHVDQYETGYRAAALGMRKLRKEPAYVASAVLPMLVPPAGYTTMQTPFREIMEHAKSMVADGTLLDFSIFQVQPWLDIKEVAGRVIAIAETPEQAKTCAAELAKQVWDARDGFWPDLMSVDTILDRAESPESVKPVVLVDASDSPNGGAVGDSVAVAMRILERGSQLKTALFVKDPECVHQAFSVGVGGSAEFTLGAKFTPGMPGPMKAVGRVKSLHDGWVVSEGPAERGFGYSIGLAAVVAFGNMDVLICESPKMTSDPQFFRHFGIEPTLYDLIVMKANTSFRAPYSRFAQEFYNADTPGAGASNLTWFQWKKIPGGLYPFTQDQSNLPEPTIER